MRTHAFLLVPFLLAVGCASSPPPKELIDARAAYQRAAIGPAAHYDPRALHEAQNALTAAEQSFQDHGDAQDVRDLAYVAQRRAQLADANAATAAAGQRLAVTSAELEKRTRERLAQDEQALQAQSQALEQERQRRELAEKRAQQMSADLARIATVKQEPRGMVITLSGSVLFTSAQSTLAPEAQARLSQVADALVKTDPDQPIAIEGYTDSQGGVDYNEKLSQKRAEAVRDFLVAHGVAKDRITAKGMGPANPVASNDTAEGRANNRRVEIIVGPQAKPGE